MQGQVSFQLCIGKGKSHGEDNKPDLKRVKQQAMWTSAGEHSGRRNVHSSMVQACLLCSRN